METTSQDLRRALARIDELEREVHRYRSLVENVPAFLAELTPDGHYVYLNKFAPGFTIDDIRGKSIFDLIDPRDHASVTEAIATVHRTRAPFGRTFVAPGAHGKPTRYFQVFAPLVRDGEIAALLAVATDVSPVVDAMAALEESEAKLRIAVAASQIGFWTFDPEDKAGGTADARTLELLGARPETTRAERVGFVHPEDRGKIESALAATLRTGEPYGPVEFRLQGSAGQERWLEGRGSLGRDASGKPRVIGSIVDITERKRREARHAQELRLESIGRLAGGIAHDFNNMLTAMLSCAEIALEDLEPGNTRDAVAEIRGAALRSAELTARLLAFARRQNIHPTVLDINDLVRHVESLLGRLLGEQIQIVTALGATRRVRVDRGQFEQLLVNLATNARDAMPGGGRLIIETLDAVVDERAASGMGSGQDREAVRIRVSDDGHGISPEHLAHVFEPFFTTKEVGAGTGLGLAMAYGVVTQHGGHINVESHEGRGTTFTITLPAESVAEADATRAPAAREPVPGAAGEHLLVVEDEPGVRAVVVTVLRRRGYHVIEAVDGHDALEKAADPGLRIDLVVTDLVMPRLGGRALVEALRKTRPELLVLYTSGYAEDASEARRDLRSRFLAKPFLASTLVGEVRSLLGEARAST